MTLNYTEKEALNLIKNVYGDDYLSQIHKASFKLIKLVETNKIDLHEALNIYLKDEKDHDNIVLFVAMNRMLKDESVLKLYKVKYYKGQRNQIAEQLFALESNNTNSETKNVRQIYIEQQSLLNTKIKDLLNSFTVTEPAFIDYRLNR